MNSEISLDTGPGPGFKNYGTRTESESVKAASHIIRLRYTIRLMGNGSLPTCSKNTITDNTGLLKTILSKPEVG